MPRLLLLLPQLPQDPASGAARSMRVACELLATAGWTVRALAVTATESTAPLNAADILRASELDVAVRPPHRAIYRHDQPVLECTDAGIHYQLLETPRHTPLTWSEKHGAQFNRLFQRELTNHRPNVIFAFGGFPPDLERYRRARAAGIKVVIGLLNHGYTSAGWLRELDGALTCSHYLSGIYRAAQNIEGAALLSPINPAETIATDHQPVFFTAINPSLEKGAFFLARLAEELSVARPDLPMLFIESRGSAGMLVQAGLAGGFDLRRHANLMFSPAVPKPAEIFRVTRVLLVPSVWEEAFGRVAAEALLNGVPPLVSDRGGLPEAANGGGYVLPLPASLTLETRVPVAAIDVKPWLEVMIRLADDASCYAEASARARAASGAWSPDQLAPRLNRFFTDLVRDGEPA